MKKALALAITAALLLGAGSNAVAQTAVQLVTQATGQPAPSVVNPTNPLPVTGSFSVTGTANVNISQINGAAPSITNPIWIANAEAADATGTFTNATQTTSITNTNADGYATALLSINGTYGTATGVFEESDDSGTTWYGIICTRSDGTASETGYTGLTNTNRQWSCPVAGNDAVRIRSTAVASGTVNARVGISAPTNNSGVVSGVVGITPTGAFVADTPTIQNASYISGNCMGGFQTVALGTTQSVLSEIGLASQGGLVSAKQIYVFAANPTGSTCTDKSTFTIATADLSKLLTTFSLTPAVPTGTTKSFASQASLALGVPSGGTVYIAMVETTTETPATTTDLVLTFSPF